MNEWMVVPGEDASTLIIQYLEPAGWAGLGRGVGLARGGFWKRFWCGFNEGWVGVGMFVCAVFFSGFIGLFCFGVPGWCW